MKPADKTDRILIVDDSTENVDILANALKSEYKIVAALNGAKALEIASSSNPPDLILLDITMPEMDGYEVLTKLKEKEVTKNIPVIFVTYSNEDKAEEKGLTLGAVDYIRKPFSIEIVRARVRAYLNLKKYHDQLREKDLLRIEMDRTSAINSLAAGIAHEINTPLGIIQSTLSSLVKDLKTSVSAITYVNEKCDSSPFLKAYEEHLKTINYDRLKDSGDRKIERIKRTIKRISNIINDLKNFSGIDKEPVNRVDLNSCIDESIRLTMSLHNNCDVQFTKDYAALPLLECSPSEIKQAIFQIINNSIDACDNNGTIEIKTSFNEKNSAITVVITDNGVGIEPENICRVFHPFFTTKPVGSGTGIGLTIAEQTIQKHHGQVHIDSKQNKGTTVTIELPIKS